MNVDVAAYNSKVYYVQGDVAAPGRLPVTGSETVLDAINHAGGKSPHSAPARIRLVRPASAGKGGGQILNVDLEAILSRGDTTTNYQILPGDRIIVVTEQKPQPDRDDPPSPAGAGDLRRLENRLAEVERRLDRVIELLGGLPEGAREQPARPARPAVPTRPSPLQR